MQGPERTSSLDSCRAELVTGKVGREGRTGRWGVSAAESHGRVRREA